MSITSTELRKNFADILNRVKFGNETIIIEKKGKPIAVMLPKTESLTKWIKEKNKQE